MNSKITVRNRSLLGSLWHRLTKGGWKLHAAPEWESFAGPDWLDTLFSIEVADRFHAKQGRSIARGTLTNDRGSPLTVYLKRHYILGRIAGWLATLLPWRARSPGWQEWQHLQWAASIGLPVPRVWAAGEKIGPQGKLQSFLAVEELPTMLPLHEAIPLAQSCLDPTSFSQWKRRLIREMARLSLELHNRSHFHKDLYLCHFYIAEEDCKTIPMYWRDRVFMIDFHRLGHHPLSRLWWVIKDLGQLLYSSEIPGVTARDRVRFWKIYCPKGTFARRWLAMAIRQKGKLYRRHNPT